MRVRASTLALESIQRTIAYYKSRNPQAAEAFKADVRACRQRLALYPEIGWATDDEGTRLALTSRFRYLVYCEVVDEMVVLIEVRAPARERLAIRRPGPHKS